MLGRRSVLQGSQRCFIPHRSVRCNPLCTPAWIQLAMGEMCDCLSSASSHRVVNTGAALHHHLLETSGSRSMERRALGAPLHQATLSHPRKVETHLSFILSFFTSAADT